MREVWIIESGEYEDKMIWAVASNPEAAERYIKLIFGDPYIVEWEKLTQEDDSSPWILRGKFSAVEGHSADHDQEFYISNYDVNE